MPKHMRARLFYVLVAAMPLIFFQNCTGGFKPNPGLSQSSQSSSGSVFSLLQITDPAPSAFVATSQALSGSCIGGTMVEITGDIQSPVNLPCADGKFSARVQFSSEDGMKTVVVRQGSNSYSRSFMLDTVAPELAVVAPAEGAAVRGQLSVQGVCEPGSLVNISYGASVQSLSCNGGMFSGALNLASADGMISLSFSQVDAAGNSARVTRAVLKDTLAPTLKINSPAGGASVQNGFTLAGNCESGLPVSVSGAGVSAAMSLNCTGGAFSGAISLSAGEGLKPLILSQTDAAGNTGTLNFSVNRKDPVNAPAVAITAPAANSATQGSITLQGTCTAGLNVAIAGNGVASPSSATCAAGTFSAAIALSNGDGAKNVTVSQTNGGVTGMDSRSFVKDTVAPALALSSPAANTAFPAQVNLIGSCENGLNVVISGPGVSAQASVACSGGAFSRTAVFSSGEGTKAFTLTQTDAAGNVTTVNRNFIKDSVAPAVTIASPAANTSAETGLTVTGACESGLNVEINGSGLQAPQSKACASGAYSFDILFSNGEGNKAVTVSQKDAAGNTGSASRNFIRIAAPVTLDGAMLYAQNCAGCHGALSNSTKLGRSASQISGAIASISQMQAIKLTNAQITAIADALKMSGPVQSKFTCDPAADPLPARTLRLSKREYAQTVTDLFGSSVPVATLIPEELDSIPTEDMNKGFDTVDLSMAQGHVNAYYDAAAALAEKVAANTNYITAIGTSCLSQAAPTSACVDQFIANFGLRALRRPLTSTEVAKFRGLYNTVNADAGPRPAIRVLLVAFLQSPQFLYRVEDQGVLVSGRTDLYKISPYETASRLSYLALGSMPDAALFTAAGNGGLDEPSEIQTQIRRLLTLPGAKAKARGFFAQWLRLDQAPQIDYPAAFVSGIQNVPGLRNAMITDFEDFVDYVIWTAKGDYKTLMTSNVAIVRNPDLAKIYGVASTSNQPVQLNSGTRAGLLTRPVFLQAATSSTNPIHRGAVILKRVLCTVIPSPDPNATPGALVPPTADDTKTTRQRYTEKTSPAACIGCHSVINPVGFAFETFDSIGRFRSQEAVYNSSNMLVNNLPVDASGGVQIDGAQHMVQNGIELASKVANSRQGPTCFIESYTQFTAGREPAAQDGCMMLRMEQSLTGTGGSIEKMLSSMAEGAEFTLRKVKP